MWSDEPPRCDLSRPNARAVPSPTRWPVAVARGDKSPGTHRSPGGGLNLPHGTGSVAPPRRESEPGTAPTPVPVTSQAGSAAVAPAVAAPPPQAPTSHGCPAGPVEPRPVAPVLAASDRPVNSPAPVSRQTGVSAPVVADAAGDVPAVAQPQFVAEASSPPPVPPQPTIVPHPAIAVPTPTMAATAPVLAPAPPPPPHSSTGAVSGAGSVHDPSSSGGHVSALQRLREIGQESSIEVPATVSGVLESAEAWVRRLVSEERDVVSDELKQVQRELLQLRSFRDQNRRAVDEASRLNAELERERATNESLRQALKRSHSEMAGRVDRTGTRVELLMERVHCAAQAHAQVVQQQGDELAQLARSLLAPAGNGEGEPGAEGAPARGDEGAPSAKRARTE